MRLSRQFVALTTWMWLLALPSMAATVIGPQQTPLKPLIAGLISAGDMQSCPTKDGSILPPCAPDNSFSDAFGMPGYLSGVVINLTWAQLQPAGENSLDTGALEEALANIRNYNIANPLKPLHGILRISAGNSAPAWVKAIDGGPVMTSYGQNGAPLPIPYFWTPEYETAWVGLQNALARLYDEEPLIAQVSNTTCSHQDPEPFSNWVGQEFMPGLFAVGFTNQAYYQCLLNSIHDYDAWSHTRVDFDFYGFVNLEVVDKDGTQQGRYMPVDDQAGIEVMDAFRAALGDRAIITNHNLMTPTPPHDAAIYQEMARLGPPIQFQTAVPGSDGNGKLVHWSAAMNSGASMGASAIEVWRTKVAARTGEVIQDGWNAGVCNVPEDCEGRTHKNLHAWAQELTQNIGLWTQGGHIPE